jgi:VWFA-related protein
VFRSLQSRSLRIVVAAGMVGLAVPTRGQTPSSMPPSTRASVGVPGLHQRPPEVVPTIRAYSNIVVIDVVVTDSQGNPVHGLKKSDFTLTENNKEQAVRNFEEHTAASETKVVPAPKLPPGLFTNRSPVPVNGPVNVLLLDYLNTPLTSQPYARKQLMDYLDHAPAGTRIAIFALTTQLSMLQGFTSDMGVLKAALTQAKGAPQASQLLDDPFNGGAISNTTLSDALANDPTAVQNMLTPEVVASINRFEVMRASGRSTR